MWHFDKAISQNFQLSRIIFVRYRRNYFNISYFYIKKGFKRPAIFLLNWEFIQNVGENHAAKAENIISFTSLVITLKLSMTNAWKSLKSWMEERAWSLYWQQQLPSHQSSNSPHLKQLTINQRESFRFVKKHVIKSMSTWRNRPVI